MFKKLENKIIAIDFDEVLASTFSAILDFGKEKGHFTGIYFDDLKEHYFRQIPNIGITQEQMLEIWTEFFESHKKDAVTPVLGSQNAINKLKGLGYKLHVITARWDALKQETIVWINSHFPNTFEEIHFSNYHTTKEVSKAEFCKKIGTNLIIEDNLDYSLEIADAGVNVYLIEKPWNIDRIETHPNIKKVKNWEEIISYLD